MVRAGGGVAVGAGEAQAGLLSHPLDEVGATAPVGGAGGGEPRFYKMVPIFTHRSERKLTD